MYLYNKIRVGGNHMKLFISADIEGCTGTTLSAETHKTENCYQAFLFYHMRNLLKELLLLSLSVPQLLSVDPY